MTLHPSTLLQKYFHGDPLGMIVTHGRMVAGLAVAVGRNLGLPPEELLFLEEAGMLHDIGICRIDAPNIGLHGRHPYITHGIIGREILEEEGLLRHAMVAERHIGVGLTVEDIDSQGLPLPRRDMSPQDLCEEIICFADLFYSKTPGKLEKRKRIDQVREKLGKFGEHKVAIFDSWVKRYSLPDLQ